MSLASKLPGGSNSDVVIDKALRFFSELHEKFLKTAAPLVAISNVLETRNGVDDVLSLDIKWSSLDDTTIVVLKTFSTDADYKDGKLAKAIIQSAKAVSGKKSFNDAIAEFRDVAKGAETMRKQRERAEAARRAQEEKNAAALEAIEAAILKGTNTKVTARAYNAQEKTTRTLRRIKPALTPGQEAQKTDAVSALTVIKALGYPTNIKRMSYCTGRVSSTGHKEWKVVTPGNARRILDSLLDQMESGKEEAPKARKGKKTYNDKYLENQLKKIGEFRDSAADTYRNRASSVTSGRNRNPFEHRGRQGLETLYEIRKQIPQQSGVPIALQRSRVPQPVRTARLPTIEDEKRHERARSHLTRGPEPRYAQAFEPSRAELLRQSRSEEHSFESMGDRRYRMGYADDGRAPVENYYEMPQSRGAGVDDEPLGPTLNPRITPGGPDHVEEDYGGSENEAEDNTEFSNAHKPLYEDPLEDREGQNSFRETQDKDALVPSLVGESRQFSFAGSNNEDGSRPFVVLGEFVTVHSSKTLTGLSQARFYTEFVQLSQVFEQIKSTSDLTKNALALNPNDWNHYRYAIRASLEPMKFDAIMDVLEVKARLERTGVEFSWDADWLGEGGHGLAFSQIVSLARYVQMTGAQQCIFKQPLLARADRKTGQFFEAVTKSLGVVFATPTDCRTFLRTLGYREIAEQEFILASGILPVFAVMYANVYAPVCPITRRLQQHDGTIKLKAATAPWDIANMSPKWAHIQLASVVLASACGISPNKVRPLIRFFSLVYTGLKGEFTWNSQDPGAERSAPGTPRAGV